MSRRMSYREALREALREAGEEVVMDRDSHIRGFKIYKAI